MTKRELEQKVADLEQQLGAQRELVAQLDKINQMFMENQEYSRQERLDADRILQAHRRVQELAEKERLEAQKMIEIQKQLHSLSESERMELLSTLDAQQKVQQLSEHERIEAEKIIKAHDLVERLSMDEIRQRDDILSAVLKINQQINRLEHTDELLGITLQEAVKLLEADAGLIIRHERGSLDIIAGQGFSPDRDMDELLSRLSGAFSGKNKKDKPVDQDDRLFLFSFLTRERRPVGAIYLEKRNADEVFRRLDQEFLELFASQVSTAFNNSLLFNRMRLQNKELKRMIMLKNNFIEHLSTDLRRPLERALEILQREPDNCGLIEKNLRRVRNTIDKVITLSALQKEVDEMYSHRIDVKKLIEEILENLKTESERRNLTVEIHNGRNTPLLEGNRDIVNTVLDEVICNAIVYNRPNGRVDIYLEKEDQWLIVRVEDSGVGLSREELERIFDRFYRAGTSYDLYERGAGLGLYIVRSFVESYGGTVSVSSEPAQGTTVEMRLPY